MVLFGGPSLSELARERCRALSIEVRPPVRRDDILQLLEGGYRGAVIVVDGVFHQVVSVGHKELLAALGAGCAVYGLSSMGAIRAYELRDFGMKGAGKVYRYFEQEEDFQDDEVALLHDPAPPYQAFSEPLVHIRACLAGLMEKGALSSQSAGQITGHLKALYFGERTLSLFARLLESATGRAFKELVPDIAPYRIKQRDVEDFLAGLTSPS